MKKPILEIEEKYSDDFKLEKILLSILLPDIATKNKNFNTIDYEICEGINYEKW